MLALIPIGGMVAALFVVSVLRPWLGLLLLLGLMPFNGFLLDVVGPSLHLSSTALTVLAGWHDALAGGVVVAAAVRWTQGKSFRLNLVESAAAVVLAFGAISLVISPHLATGLYAYRTLYEPIALALAIAVLARTNGLATHVPSRYVLAMVVSGVAASLFAIWQVYGAGFHYVATYYKTADGRLPAAYFSAYIVQPRAFGPFHSPNEFGAFLVIALILIATPGLLLAKPVLRPWAASVIGFVLLLSFSRSSWISLIVATVALLIMLPVTRVRLAGFFRAFATRRWWRSYAPALALFLVLFGSVAASSGVPQFATGTISGNDPSAANHAAGLTSLLNGTTLVDTGADSTSGTPTARLTPFGLGLGMAGAKSARFDQVAALDVLSSETWYVNYLFQAGFFGLLALVALALAIARALWIKRSLPMARAALAAALGLAAGAVFIPVLDEPAVAIPLWGLIGLGLGSTVAAAGGIPVSPGLAEPTLATQRA